MRVGSSISNSDGGHGSSSTAGRSGGVAVKEVMIGAAAEAGTGAEALAHNYTEGGGDGGSGHQTHEAKWYVGRLVPRFVISLAVAAVRYSAIHNRRH
ncbi:hypothetical protein PG993_009014 [Apiospora rasikravindrae]|uniref:Uncharacterized protein n=1 Tax=Apiospora rasikravindrae TaxID=990691 RepID=A0ABR1SI59_9PEZI